VSTRKPYNLIQILAYLSILLCFLLSGCVNTQPGEAPFYTGKPVILFWCDYPQMLTNITHYTTHVWVDEPYPDERGGYEWSQDYYLSRSITPLKWAGGRVFASEKPIHELVRKWCAPAKKGFVGIGIDEFGMLGPIFSAKLGKALVQAKATCPELYIAVWHSGPLTKNQAKYYVEGADLVMLEAYFSGRSIFRWLVQRNISVARNAGIIGKTVVALGINDEHPDAAKPGFWRWANTPEELEKQMRWIKQIASDMPGIAFYAPKASKTMLLEADRLAGQIFAQ
jgi:hypothetical protein